MRGERMSFKQVAVYGLFYFVIWAVVGDIIAGLVRWKISDCHSFSHVFAISSLLMSFGSLWLSKFYRHYGADEFLIGNKRLVKVYQISIAITCLAAWMLVFMDLKYGIQGQLMLVILLAINFIVVSLVIITHPHLLLSGKWHYYWLIVGRNKRKVIWGLGLVTLTWLNSWLLSVSFIRSIT